MTKEDFARADTAYQLQHKLSEIIEQASILMQQNEDAYGHIWAETTKRIMSRVIVKPKDEETVLKGPW